GPVFANLLLVDEVNRASPKTQAALLECMQESQVTVDGVSYALERPFMAMATQNPIEYEGTYPLPEAQLDRFLLRLDVGYPPPDEEVEVLRRRLARRHEETLVDAVVDADRFAALQAGVERVAVDEDVLRYCVDLTVATRSHPSVDVGASPRGAQALVLVARAVAVLDGRDYVLPEDVKECAVAALAHRLTLRAETWTSGLTDAHVINELLGSVPGPASTRP
ncbi:MAG TPA: MoxR family ATPase, partial [Mycobacteriales bacterium]|nr:MoxR family ATPase [Mycobacteriales bacterium]